MKCAIVVAASMLALTGCANLAQPTTYYEVDSARMAAVESLAQRRGVTVIWVSPPMKAVTATAAPGI